ncbi:MULTISPECIES: SRPBCC domain-containing protein [unclassified Gordonia (in: high G+C Gram-positive bacteria)]|uniref:SRPBCC family protein n=1 Tax=unclassified Gordonia (in: high G+C Gram-positive bacteria) TaxID=2657482 RepID=UPI001964802E|nr:MULTISPECIES: SRPBCC domain-containing protein [unclassified Gordonia (in: high G+C Gram-positive bacteria)]MBN0975568.1 SRPBCC domain-containing protein [Gordonia sp. BP-119]MBN0985689.1 SRPBCC domain-containing protein [Gordonia sp. BP-94]
MIEDFEPDDPSLIDLAVFVEQSPEVAWRALTEPELIAEWLSPTVGFQPIVGTTFIVQVAVPDKMVAEMACQVMVAKEPGHLAYSWTDLRGDPPLRWMMDFRLAPHGRGSRLFWQMSGFDIADRYQRFARNGIERSWNRTLLPKFARVVHSLAAN